ncbi:intermediate filament tail domain protein [Necator americanus]|uniref:Intermediate filament tail domain protein n=1 Tax=Necator americanus TaxID=51031 RepID=W2SWL4_NECAM|nr:intermediate filament tail domain protein [Necator americanus]ETN74020.1 intermediate filament tail domain protein [Necator americanus]
MMNPADFPSGRSRFGDANAFYPHEKADFQDLNVRLERYISLVKGLERDNAVLVSELRNLHESWGQQNTDYKKVIYALILSRKTTAAVSEFSTCFFSLKIIEGIRVAEQGDRARCAELRSQISKAEADLELQMRENGRLADERAQLTAQNAGLYTDYERIWDEIDRIRLELAEYQAREERLLAEKEFLLKVQEREVFEINNLLAESSFDARKFFENDIALAIKDIKLEYEASHKLIRSTVTTYYHKKADELRRMAEAKSSDETKYRRDQITKMENMIGDLKQKFRPLEDRNHMLENEYKQLQNSIKNDEDRYEGEKRRRDDEYKNALAMYQRLLAEQGAMSEVTLLELEIYRKMIECEEKRWGHRDFVKVQESYSQVTKHRTYSGDIRIKDCDEYGKYVIVENAGHGDHRLSGYRISRIVRGSERSFTFPTLFVLAPRETVQVSVRGYTPEKRDYTHHFVYDGDTTWGIDGNVLTRLYNTQGVEISNFEVRAK